MRARATSPNEEIESIVFIVMNQFIVIVLTELSVGKASQLNFTAAPALTLSLSLDSRIIIDARSKYGGDAD